MRFERAFIVTAALAICAAMGAACGPPPGPSTRVTRVNPNSQIDMSGNWNDADANQVARVMIQDCMSRPWANKFKQKSGRDPIVRMGQIMNRTPEHINVRFYAKQLEAEILNSGMATVVADQDEAEAQRDERDDQAKHASDDTVKSHGEESGSDYLIRGRIEAQNDAIDGQEVRAYVVTMELVDSQSNAKVWMKVHSIKKVINRATTQW